jgi:hypothetical protein
VPTVDRALRPSLNYVTRSAPHSSAEEKDQTMATPSTETSKKKNVTPPPPTAKKLGPPKPPPVKAKAPEAPAHVSVLEQIGVAEAPKRGRGRPPKAALLPAETQTRQVVEPPRPVAAPVAVDKQLHAQISAMGKQIADLQALVAKSRAKETLARTRTDILEGIKIAKSDWRAEYHGEVIFVKPHDLDKKTNGVIVNSGPEVANCLLAIPRDNDIGGRGSHARNAGQIAVHWECSEDGETFIGGPSYVSADELAAIWGDKNK